MVQDRLELVCTKLRQCGCRITPQRLAVIEMIFASHEHPTAQAVYDDLKERFPTMSLATVYKTLHTLQALGEVRVIAGEEEGVHYDGANPQPHVHIICSYCGNIADVEWPLPSADSMASQAAGWQISDWRLEIIGVCPQCQSTMPVQPKLNTVSRQVEE